MRKALLFAIFVGLLSVDVSMATVTQAWTQSDANSGTYPGWASGKPTTAAQLSVKDANIVTATTNYVTKQVDRAYSGYDGYVGVSGLANSATADNVSVTTNEAAIGTAASGGNAATGMFLNRVDKPANSCPANSECGYISADGPNGAKQWVQIIGAASN